jgi:hypothetical protein
MPPSTKGMFDLRASATSTPTRTQTLVRVRKQTPTRARAQARPSEPIHIHSEKLTEAEIRKLLEGYRVLESEQWPSLAPRQHIRYVRAAGNTFVRGGFIISITPGKDGQVLTLANGYDPKAPGYLIWSVALRNVKAIFVKVDALQS